MNEPCIEIGGHSGEFRGLLAHFLKTTIPTKRLAVASHGCNNSLCSQPKHLYWGTPSDNELDKKYAGTALTIWQKMVDKYGLKTARAMNKISSAKGGRTAQQKRRNGV